MTLYLARAGKFEWTVDTTVFDTIELACNHLESFYGVPDDEIDMALISIYANSHNEAIFENERFVKSRK